MSTLEVGGAQLYFETHGLDGDWVTLINGYTRTSRDFRRLAGNLVAAGRRVLCLDNRGAGRTVVAAPFSMNDMTADIFALWDHLAIKKSHLLGISMGGMICQQVAIEAPSAVNKLILVSTAARRSWLAERPEVDFDKDILATLRPFVSERFFNTYGLLMQSAAKAMAKEIAAGGFFERTAMQRRAIEEYDAVAHLHKITADTLILHGREDRIIRWQAADEMKAHIAVARCVFFENTGHMLLAETPMGFWREVLAFFG